MEIRTFFKYFKFVAIAISVFFIFQCSQDRDKSEYGTFDIYLIYDSELTHSDFNNTAIEEIDLPEEPVASIRDIDTYKIFQSESGLSLAHSIIYKSEMKEKFGYNNCLFVLVVNEIRKYKGEYWANFMDTYPMNVTLFSYSNSEFHILAHDEGKEKINDTGIFNTLIESGVDVVYENIGGSW